MKKTLALILTAMLLCAASLIYPFHWSVTAGSTPAAVPAAANPDPVEPLLAAIEQERGHLRAGEAQLQEHESQLLIRTRQLDEREQRLGELRKSVEAEIQKLQTARSERFATNVKLYQEMQPRNAAVALSGLYDDDPRLALDVLGAIPPRNGAKILDALSGLRPDLVARLTGAMSSPTRRPDTAAPKQEPS